jgi:transglutaminase-like putative cysteine protease
MFQKFLLVIVFSVFISDLNAQKFELGKVTVKELQEKLNPDDTTASAAILYKKARTYFTYNRKQGFTATHECEFRIKIYKKEGLDWANFSIPYYVGYEELNDDMVKFSNCVTYNLENGSIVKTKLNGEGKFKKNVNEYWNEASITMPNVKEGSVVEFKYTLKSENVVKFPTFDFQYDIPVNFVEYKTEIPEFYIYKPILTGFFRPESETKVVSGYQNFDNENNHTVNLSYQQINTIYSAYKVPAIKEERYVDNIDNYKSSVKYELEKTRFPDVPEKNYSLTWEDVAKTIFKEKEFGKQITEHAYFEQDLRTILKNATTESEKINTIFKFVQNKMHWNNEYSYYSDKGVKKAYEENTGNAAEINFILIAMLNYAGINANAVLTSTISHGIPVFPSRTIFNYVVASAKVDGKNILMDATNKFTTPNILPFYALNWTGRMIRQDGTSEEINLVPKTMSKELFNMMVSIDATGKVSGKFRVQKTDYEALRFREKYGSAASENYLEKIENDFDGIHITDYSVENKATDLSQPIIETFNFTSDNVSEIIGDKIFINPLLFFTQTKNPFVQEKRELPIYFGYPAQEKYNITFEIPAGYTVESLPKSITIATPENIGLFSFKIVAAENKIQVSVTSEMNTALVSADFYDTLKMFYQKAIDKQNEKIVLKKI